jgi:integrase
VLSADEVVRFLEAIPSLKSRTALTTVYAAGLRVSEVVLLKIADIDSQRIVIRIEQGKGGKDRYVMLSPQLLQRHRADQSLQSGRSFLPRRLTQLRRLALDHRPRAQTTCFPLGRRNPSSTSSANKPLPPVRSRSSPAFEASFCYATSNPQDSPSFLPT